jgi:hypothetical protein
MRTFRLILIVLMGLTAAGCAQTLGSHQVSLGAVEMLRSGNIPPMRVGKFALAPGRLSSVDKSVGIRSVSLSSPDGASFAEYLGKTLETDLRAAGKLDPNSNFIVQGLLTDSSVSAGIADGTASLGAKFSLLREGKTVFEKTLTVHSEWGSSFVGAIAIPGAINQYSSLYDKLVLHLLADEDFKRALIPSIKTSFLQAKRFAEN